MTLVAEVDLIGLGDGLGVLRQPTTPGRQDQAAARGGRLFLSLFLQRANPSLPRAR